jgi:hypothetical protein
VIPEEALEAAGRWVFDEFGDEHGDAYIGVICTLLEGLEGLGGRGDDCYHCSNTYIILDKARWLETTRSKYAKIH